MNTPESSIAEAVAALRHGEPIVIVDDEERENEGDLVLAASTVTPEIINFLTWHARGLLCVALDAEHAHRLRLRPMVERGEDHLGTAFTVSVDAAPAHGVTTGISAADRARTITVLADPAGRPEDLTRPGHVFPLVARPGGVLERRGHTEASTDLCREAGLEPVAAIAEILRGDGAMARRAELHRFAARHRFPLVTVEQIVRHRRAARLTEAPVGATA